MKKINILLFFTFFVLVSACHRTCSGDAINTLDQRFKMYTSQQFSNFKDGGISDILVEYDSDDCCALSFTSKGQKFGYYYVEDDKHYDFMDPEGGTLINEAKSLFKAMKSMGFDAKGDEDDFIHKYIYDMVKDCKHPF